MDATVLLRRGKKIIKGGGEMEVPGRERGRGWERGHVTELKEKIDQQIVVTKNRTGGSQAELVVR